MKHILVATDGSDPAERAVTEAAQFATALHGDLAIIYVEGRTGAVSVAARVERRMVGDMIDQQAKRILMKALEKARAAGLADASTETAWGEPAEVIIDAIRRRQIDIVVVGRRGRRRLEDILDRSVSVKLARAAPCTVVIVP